MLDNEGVAFDDAHDAVFDEFLARHFGGFTRLPAEAGGGWFDKDSTYYPDTMRGYIVGVDGIIAGAEPLRLMVNIVKAHYRQKAVFLQYLGVIEVL